MGRDWLIDMGAQGKIINRGPSPSQQNMKIEKKKALYLTYFHYSDKYAFSTNNYYLK